MSLGEVIKACSLTDDKNSNGKADIDDMITCSTESFHVISNENGMISMLAQYNLEVGYINRPDICEEECQLACYEACYDECYQVNCVENDSNISNPSGIQSEKTKNITNSSERYGVTDFSTTNYWYNYSDGYIIDTNYLNEGRSYPFVYGDYKDTNGKQQNLLYPYLKAYEEYLISEGVNSAKATLISYEQANDLKVNKGNPNWLYTTSYWTGSVYFRDGYYMWYVSGYGNIYEVSYSSYGHDASLGVRPVVNISVNEI